MSALCGTSTVAATVVEPWTLIVAALAPEPIMMSEIKATASEGRVIKISWWDGMPLGISPNPMANKSEVVRK